MKVMAQIGSGGTSTSASAATHLFGHLQAGVDEP